MPHIYISKIQSIIVCCRKNKKKELFPSNKQVLDFTQGERKLNLLLCEPGMLHV